MNAGFSLGNTFSDLGAYSQLDELPYQHRQENLGSASVVDDVASTRTQEWIGRYIFLDFRHLDGRSKSNNPKP